MTTRSPYAIPANRWCPGCFNKGFHYRQDDPRHYELHVPRSRWPENMRPAHKERVVINGLVYDADKMPSEYDDEAVSEDATASVSGDFPNEQDAESPSASETATLVELMRGVPAQTDDTETPEEITTIAPATYLHGNESQSDNPLQCPMCSRVSTSLTGAKSHERAHMRSNDG